jgi:anti-anti-sigma factor
MEFSHRIENGICIISVEGNIALDGVSTAKSYLKTHIEDEAVKGIVINFENVNFIDSSGIGLIVSVFKTMQERNGSFAITNLSKKNEEIFTITRLNKILNIYPTESEALSSISG